MVVLSGNLVDLRTMVVWFYDGWLVCFLRGSCLNWLKGTLQTVETTVTCCNGRIVKYLPGSSW